MENKPPNKKYSWSRTDGYEISSKGDKRFSAFYAKLEEKSIEEIYQLDIKGYRAFSNNLLFGKGKPPLTNFTKKMLFRLYTNLWREWVKNHPKEISYLKNKLKEHDNILMDRFANTPINQAHALSKILNEMEDNI
jgi:hypothetical protein